MNLRKDHLTASMLAVLPLALEMQTLKAAALYGGFAVVGLWLSLFIFLGGRNLFPGRLVYFSLVIWLAVLGQCAHDLAGLQPLGCLSILLLLPKGLLVASEPHQKTGLMLIARGLIFFGLCAFLGICFEVFAGTLKVWALATPAGLFAFLALADVIRNHQPARRGVA